MSLLKPFKIIAIIILKTFSFVLNVFLTICCIPLLFLCATGLMMATSSTIHWSFLETSAAILWSIFGMMGIFAFFATWFKKPGRILVVFTICGIIAVLPFVYIGATILIKGAASIESLGINFSNLPNVLSELAEKDGMFIQRLLVSQTIILALVLAPTLLVLKALYVLLKAHRENLKNKSFLFRSEN